MKDLMEIFGVVVGLAVAVVVFVAGAWLLSTAVSALTVAALWNWFGLHAYFHLAALSFWQTLGAGAALNVLDGIFGARDSAQRIMSGWKAGKEKKA